MRRLAARKDAHRVALSKAPAGYLSGKTAEVEVGSIDPLHGKPKRFLLIRADVQLNRLKMIDERGALVPIRFRR